MCIGFHVQLCLSDLKQTCIFSKEFTKIPIGNITKYRAVGAELLHADKRSPVMKLMVAFSKIAKKSLKTDESVSWPQWTHRTN